MQLHFHGGKCCGIKTITGFGSYNEGPGMTALKKNKTEVLNHDKVGSEVTSSIQCFADEAPRETRGERLVRILKYVDKWRPSGIVEVALAQSPNNDVGPYRQITYWEETLIELGFEKVGRRHVNSNTGSEIQVYHRYSTPAPVVKEKPLRQTVEEMAEAACVEVEAEVSDAPSTSFST